MLVRTSHRFFMLRVAFELFFIDETSREEGLYPFGREGDVNVKNPDITINVKKPCVTVSLRI